MILVCLWCLGMHFDSIFDPQIGPKSTPGGLLGRLGASWGRLGASWEGLGAIFEGLGVSRAVWTAPRRPKRPPGVEFGLFWDVKNRVKMHQKRSRGRGEPKTLILNNPPMFLVVF